jgi:serine/threonine protein kinase
LVQAEVAKGGEAFIDLVRDQAGKTLVLKRFRSPDDPVFATKLQKKAASLKLHELVSKFATFPKLPKRVVAPLKAIVTPERKVYGYTMEYIDHSFQLSKIMSGEGRAKHGVTLNQVTEIFLDLYDVIEDLHKRGVVIGDLKPENILIRNLKPYIIDAESMQFGPFTCHAYSDEWVDPRLCREENGCLIKTKSADTASDWYAFSCMFFEAITGMSPYGGTAFTKKGLLSEATRKLHGISVFTKGVRIPAFALKPEHLHPELAAHFRNTFGTAQNREKPRRELLENIIWKSCKTTEREYSASICPCGRCGHADVSHSVANFSPAVRVREFPIKGHVVATSLEQDTTLSYLQYSGEQGKLLRGPARVVGTLKDPSSYSQYLLSKGAVCLIKDDTLVIKRDKTTWRMDLAKAASPSLPRVATCQDTAAIVTPTGVSLLDLTTGDTMKNLNGGHDVQGIWLQTPTTGVAIGMTNDGTVAIQGVMKDGFADIKGVPHLVGELLAARVYFSKGVSWTVVRIKDRGEISDYLLCLNSRTLKLQAFCKTDEPLIDDFFEGAVACHAHGEEFLYSRFNAKRNAYQLVGSKIVPRQVEPLREIRDTSIVHSRDGIVYVSNPLVEH